TILANAAGNAVGGNGTSYSNPNMAGLVACLWEAFPEFTNMEIINAVQESSDHFTNPDGRYGYGIPNFRIAYGTLLKERQRRKYQSLLGDGWIKAYPVPFKGNVILLLKSKVDGTANIQLVDALGRTMETKSIPVNVDQYYPITFDHSSTLAKGVYFVRFSDGKNKVTIKLLKQ